MQSEKAATGRRTLLPAQEYCHLCPLQRPVPSLGHGLPDGLCPALEPCLSPLQWRRDLAFPFPPGSVMGEDIVDHEHCVSQNREVYLHPNHYPVSCEACSPPCYSWREVRASRWDWPPDRRLSTCMCAWERHRPCGCMRHWHHPDLSHPFNGSPAPQLPLAKARGHRYYREARYVSEEHYWDCTNEDFHKDEHLQRPEWDNPKLYGYNGHCEKRHVTFECHEDGNRCTEDNQETSQQSSPERTHCNGPPAFFATEVPQSKFRSSRTSGPVLRVSSSHDGELKLGQARRPEVGASHENQRNQRSQGTVREQIKQVVTELEDVLGGLKQVQLEMKEVVQQIDILTSNIDLGEDDHGSSSALPLNPMHNENRIGIVALIHNFNGDPESPQRNGPLPGVKSRIHHSLLDHSMAIAASSGTNIRAATSVDHTNPSSPFRGPAAVEFADCRRVNHTSATEMQRTKSTANGDCLRARPPRVKVKDLQSLKGRGDQAVLSKSCESPFPLVSLSLTKTQRPPPYPQNGQVKMPPQDSSQAPNASKLPPYPGKQKQLSSTAV